MKFEDVPKGSLFRICGQRAVFVRTEDFSLNCDSTVLKIGTGKLFHIRDIGGKTWEERGDYELENDKLTTLLESMDKERKHIEHLRDNLRQKWPQNSENELQDMFLQGQSMSFLRVISAIKQLL